MRLNARGIVVTLARTDVVRGVDLDLPKGEIVGVLGPSGAGKTTLFRALAGELPVSSGSVLMDGHDVTSLPLWHRARRGLGYVPQTPSVLCDLSVEDNLRTFQAFAGRPRGESPSVWAALVELDQRMAVRAGSLSGGERRRLELARALVAGPSLLVCDEPFSGIDPGGAERVGDLLRRQAAAGMAVLFADHHVAEALRVCDRAMLLLDGKVEVMGTPEVFRNHPLVEGRYLGSWHRSIPVPKS
jgi:lipopolysaccharide export system ATP-binding protein